MQQSTTAGSVVESYPLTDEFFVRLRDLVIEHTGIQITDDKRDLLINRLQKRIRKLRLSGFPEYYDLISRPKSEEFESFINAVTTNLTSFFREKHHFEHLQDISLPELSRQTTNHRRLRVWSAGCSSGEEPYSIAMVLRENAQLFSGWDCKILATDLDSNVLTAAASGIYRQNNVNGMNDAVRVKRWFDQNDAAASAYTVKPELQELVHFKKLNLLGDWPFKGLFNIIFCRNVLIYFDKDTQRRVVEHFARFLADDGYLYVGHSESLARVTDVYERVGNTIYRKKI